MESFVTVTSQTTREGGSSHASSSRAVGKAPAVPQKRVSKASGGRRRKCPKTLVDVIELESLTYHEPESDSEPELLPPLPATEPGQIQLHGGWYRKAGDVAGQKCGKKRSSHIWGDKMKTM
jgi:hypothetical protein